MSMFAFAAPISLRNSARIAPGQSLVCDVDVKRSRAPARACANNIQSDLSKSVDAGKNMREELQKIAEQRQQQAERTSKAIEDMNQQLATIMTSLRKQAGMPPVSSPPTPDAAVPNVANARDGVPAASSSDENASTTADEPYMDPKNFGYESSAGWQVLAAEDQLPENQSGNLQFRIECDMNGCSIIELQGDAAPGPGVRKKFIHSGPGFRVGYDPEAPKSFCAMVGSEQWLLALSQDEIRHFKRLCLSVQKKMNRIGSGEEDAPMKKPTVRRSGDGMFNVRVARAGLDCSVELESKLVWVQAIGQPVLGQYCIRAIFMEGRQSECFWGTETVPNLFNALPKLGLE